MFFELRYLWMLPSLFILLLSIVFSFTLHIYKTDCKSIGNDPTENPIQMYCNDGEYNVIGAIWFQTPEQSVRYVPTDHRYRVESLLYNAVEEKGRDFFLIKTLKTS